MSFGKWCNGAIAILKCFQSFESQLQALPDASACAQIVIAAHQATGAAIAQVFSASS